jgi:hypothetical protein
MEVILTISPFSQEERYQMSEQETHVLTWSSNRGRYCFDDPQSGKDIISGEPITQESLQKAVSAAMAKGMSLAGALDATTGKVTGLFAGYYFLSIDGQILGLCTWMHVRSRSVFCAHAG